MSPREGIWIQNTKVDLQTVRGVVPEASSTAPDWLSAGVRVQRQLLPTSFLGSPELVISLVAVSKPVREQHRSCSSGPV